MTKTEALDYIAAKLAFNSLEHVEAARKDPNLRDNTANVRRLNAEAAEALGVGDVYRAALNTLNVR